MKKKLLWLTVAIILLLIESLFYAARYPSSPEKIYLRNQEEFHAAAEQILASGSAEDVSIEGVKAIDFWSGSSPIIEFHTSGFGLAPSSCYKGLYYSPSDTPAAFQNIQNPLVASETGWTWTDGTDNHGSTARIAPCWFTFEAYF